MNKKVLSCALMGATVANSVLPVMATEITYPHMDKVQYDTDGNSVAEVHEEVDVTADGTSTTNVYAELGKEFLVTIPKSLTLSGTSKTGAYTVEVEGDIAGTDIVKVVPDETFALKSTGLNDVTANIEQDKTSWAYDEILDGSDIIGNGAIDAKDLTAGIWNGTFNFNINLEENGSGMGNTSKEKCEHNFVNHICDKCNTQEAGLYDANGVMLASWEEAGIDVEMNYSKDSSASNYYKTAETSAYTVLNKSEYVDVTKVIIPDSVTNIGTYTFRGCEKLTSIKIPDSVTSIGEYAFAECTKLVNINIPEGITSIEANTFYNCKKLTTIEIPDSVTIIKDKAFQNCSDLENITIPDNVTSIGKYAFCGCYDLTNVKLGNKLTNIELYAFESCSNLTSIEIPEGVISIGDEAFYRCKKLTSIKIPDSVTSIGKNVFGSCTELTNIIVDENNQVYDSRNNCNGIIETKTNKLIQGCKKTTIPSTVTVIGGYAFNGCTGLTSIIIPDSVTIIEDHAFYNCTGLTSIMIPDSVTIIEDYTFSGCENLTSVTFKDTTTWYIGTLALPSSATTQVTVTNASTNATNLTTTYYNKCWVKK